MERNQYHEAMLAVQVAVENNLKVSDGDHENANVKNHNSDNSNSHDDLDEGNIKK